MSRNASQRFYLAMLFPPLKWFGTNCQSFRPVFGGQKEDIQGCLSTSISKIYGVYGLPLFFQSCISMPSFTTRSWRINCWFSPSLVFEGQCVEANRKIYDKVEYQPKNPRSLLSWWSKTLKRPSNIERHVVLLLVTLLRSLKNTPFAVNDGAALWWLKISLKW